MAVENDLAELKGIGQKHAATLKEIRRLARSCATAMLPTSRR
jgi:hypothetical protein